MILDLTLLSIFFISVFILWYRISEKIPELVAVPDEVIAQRLHEDSAKLHLFLLNAKKWYKEKHYQQTFWSFLGKTLYKFHIALLRIDNSTVSLLKKIRAHGVSVNGNSDGKSDSEYWKKLQQSFSSPVLKDNRIREVRVKK